ncbi:MULTISPECIES: hypothetical protein [Prochlorococcus]|uniref:Uncharacterized protein n=1 Tax=Prochlorococcus marinus (strain SARG / CCMP1375 / SS120) TaxID=167539 RepID=Q7VCE3_PROMA|nr:MULTISPECIES: hypothetical protein [Prochlorococcus]AAP99841.1 Predicted protein [Prochlorococcus marinus subsp. marinus str. CCMP1375]KGG11812.1 hypothetical protein EV04_0837 [Prochlorococcus marinus str. LG]KGG21881.1 hypothetical protein EV08_0486 [Prochlorococcus marinus str. SS2]KGG23688.1 hypothetical protein EV09_1313 [Prochlorococcus marinus str. SS35]KGG32076.1 hypothetical protein EV10_1190 [Prochlorococcus marinus str. SS51]
MNNDFFVNSKSKASIASRLRQLKEGKVGFYSIGLYPASLAYNCAMHTKVDNLLLAPRPGRELLGAFSDQLKSELNPECVKKMYKMSLFRIGSRTSTYQLTDLLEKCELVILSANSNHIENDLNQACELRERLGRQNVVLACFVGSFTYDENTKLISLLCQKYSNLAFFSGFHRHGALRNKLDSFTANFCHPDPFISLIGARLLDRLSPNIQVSAGVHNVEGQYIKAAKNISSIFAGFGHTFHQNNPGLLPTILTLLLNQCLDQAATVSMSRDDRDKFYSESFLPLTEIGYGVQCIEAALSKKGKLQKVRDHTFTQLTAMIADVKGSMMLPVSGEPTRNFQVGQILARNMYKLKRCPLDIQELIGWCEKEGLPLGALEGINSLQYWPQIIKKYSIPFHDTSMINLLYMSIFATDEIKVHIFKIMTNSRELTKFCQESVLPDSSLKMNELLNNIDINEVLDFITTSLSSNKLDQVKLENVLEVIMNRTSNSPFYKSSYEEIKYIFNTILYDL